MDRLNEYSEMCKECDNFNSKAYCKAGILLRNKKKKCKYRKINGKKIPEQISR